MKLFLKRDNSSEGHPHPDQLEVGELVMNSVTGRLYTKLIDGSIVEWISQRVCFDVAPTLSYYYDNIEVFDSINGFCCAGDILVVQARGLKPPPANYVFEFVELTSNTVQSNINLSPPQFTPYTETKDDEVISLREATIPINLSIDKSNNISIFKFIVSLDGRKLIEKLINIKCFEEGCFRTN